MTQAVTTGLTQALSGMAVAFSNSLVGILSAVILTVFGVFSNLADRRVALYDPHRDVPRQAAGAERGAEAAAQVGSGAPCRPGGPNGRDREGLRRIGGAARRESSAGSNRPLTAFSGSTRDFTEFNAHLKDNVQRMSLSFGDLSDTLKTQVGALKRQNGQ